MSKSTSYSIPFLCHSFTVPETALNRYTQIKRIAHRIDRHYETTIVQKSVQIIEFGLCVNLFFDFNLTVKYHIGSQK